MDKSFQIESILLIDDEIAICNNLRDYLEDYGFAVEIAHNGHQGLEKYIASRPDLVILDLHMPVMTGHELLKELTRIDPDIPKIVLSGVGDVSEAMETVTEGSWDFIPKPLHDLEILRHKILLAEEKATLLKQNKMYRKHLEVLVEEKTQDILLLNKQLLETQKEIVSKLGDVIETRSKETGYHVRRVAYISRILALEYGLAPEEADIIRMASPLHDVGKIGIPDCILNKCGKLTGEEFEQIKAHTEIGHSILSGTEQPIIQAGAIIALQHHERWDGNGYPYGLKGEEIHIYGRVTCLADVYDALRQERPYKRAWSRQEVGEYIQEHSGKFFDPVLVRILMRNIERIEKIIQEYTG